MIRRLAWLMKPVTQTWPEGEVVFRYGELVKVEMPDEGAERAVIIGHRKFCPLTDCFGCLRAEVLLSDLRIIPNGTES